MSKKFLIILFVVLFVILAVGFAVYERAYAPENKTKQLPTASQNNANAVPQVQVQVGGVQAQGENGGGALTVCMDKCGDGVCQKTDPTCGKGNNLNCICPETPQDCPKDCK